MARTRSTATLIAAATMLAGCSFAADAFWPSLGGGESASESSQPQVASTQAGGAGSAQAAQATEPGAPPPLGTTNFVPPSISQAKPTGTFVGEKVVQVRNELERLLGQIAEQNRELQRIRTQTREHSRAYHENVAVINTRLQVGSTPGNPELVSRWNAAQGELAKIDSDIAAMNALANRVAGTSTLSAYLLETVRAAYGLTGAVEEDHRQLAVLEDEVNRTVVLIDRLLNELSEDINRQSNYLANERGNLTTLAVAIKNGELFGTSLQNRAFASAAPSGAALSTPSMAAAPTAERDLARRRPLVVIRFDRPNVAYEQPLYTAVSRALERKPDATFDLVAIAPNRGTEAQIVVAQNNARRNAEQVLRSLSDMGLPLDRVRLSATTSAAADSTEVHLYVR